MKRSTSGRMRGRWRRRDSCGRMTDRLSLLSTRAKADWGCAVASRVALEVLVSIPAESKLKADAEFFFRRNFRSGNGDAN